MAKILLLSAHVDDSEIAAGGFISKSIREGNRVIYVAFSATDKRKQLIKELNNAMKTLNVKEFTVFSYKTRNFSKDRQAILEDMIKMEKKYNPDIIIGPSSSDGHQDHIVIRKEMWRAFKNHSIIGYECPQNNNIFRTDLFIKLSKEDIDNKIRAIKCYKSQTNKIYINEDVIRGSARLRGAQINTEFAESFEVIRWIL